MFENQRIFLQLCLPLETGPSHFPTFGPACAVHHKTLLVRTVWSYKKSSFFLPSHGLGWFVFLFLEEFGRGVAWLEELERVRSHEYLFFTSSSQVLKVTKENTCFEHSSDSLIINPWTNLSHEDKESVPNTLSQTWVNEVMEKPGGNHQG